MLREAAKAQLRRMCTLKKKRRDLNVPDWVVKEFKNRPQAETASLLMKCNFCKARSSHIWHMKFEDQQQLEFLYIFFTCVQPPTRAQEKFISSLEIVVKRRSSQKVIVDEEWLTEKEMKEDYGWSAHFPYSMGFV